MDDLELTNERLSPSSPPATPSTTSDDDNWAPYQRPFNGAKSVRWFRDDRGLWSEQTRASPYQRPPRNTNRNNNNNLNNRNTSSSNSGRTTPATPKDVSKEVSEALIEAVRRQDLSELDNLILRSGVDGNNINCLGREGDSPLHRSCRLGALETVKLLVRHGADPELTNREGWSPLHLAVDSGYQDVVVYLLSLSRR